MKRFIAVVTIILLMAPVTALSQSDWNALITQSGATGYSVEGATKIDVSTAKTMHESDAKFFDARENWRWKLGHIPGAFSFNVVSETTLMELADKTDNVVFYCGGTGCKLSANASAEAIIWGYENVYYFAEGLPGWNTAGYSIEASE